MNKILIAFTIFFTAACTGTVSAPEADLGWKANAIASALDKSGRKIADSSNRYSIRLERVAKRVKEISTQEVYIDTKIDVFMLGTNLRVNSGLMDIMRDDELLSLIIKEYAHNKLGHYENRFVNVQDGYEQALEFNFTDSQNSSADAYTLNYFNQNKFDSQAVVNAAYKLAKLQEKSAIGKEPDLTFSPRLVNKHSIDRARALAGMLQESKTNDQYLIGLIQNEEPVAATVNPTAKKEISVSTPKLEAKTVIEKPEVKKEAVIAKYEEPEEKKLIPETKKLSSTGVKTASLSKTPKTENVQASSSELEQGWYLQISAEDNQAAANSKIQKLNDASYRGAIQEISVNGQKFFRILIGPYASKAELAEAKKSSLAKPDSFSRFVE